ncbi:hypothetical protein F443_22382 [Phytophthora nicotianae P1569]|uniref:Uncharacterized protein n=1 Tax=Phytophthora nicotianae P1569 TaxID=1317065 RepID=V9DUE6_PHYNI|nr:hypothetical protein F443_22382 [Phytophthora nicotianae P1569]
MARLEGFAKGKPKFFQIKSAFKQVFDIRVSHRNELRKQVAEAEDRLSQSSTVPQAETPKVNIFENNGEEEEEEEEETEESKTEETTGDNADTSFEPQTVDDGANVAVFLLAR